MYEARSLDRNRKAFAMSSGSPILPAGILLISGCIIWSGNLATMSVRMIPGATALTRILSLASSLARDFVSPFTAYFDAG